MNSLTCTHKLRVFKCCLHMFREKKAKYTITLKKIKKIKHNGIIFLHFVYLPINPAQSCMKALLLFCYF